MIAKTKQNKTKQTNKRLVGINNSPISHSEVLIILKTLLLYGVIKLLQCDIS